MVSVDTGGRLRSLGSSGSMKTGDRVEMLVGICVGESIGRLVGIFVGMLDGRALGLKLGD